MTWNVVLSVPWGSFNHPSSFILFSTRSCGRLLHHFTAVVSMSLLCDLDFDLSSSKSCQAQGSEIKHVSHEGFAILFFPSFFVANCVNSLDWIKTFDAQLGVTVLLSEFFFFKERWQDIHICSQSKNRMTAVVEQAGGMRWYICPRRRTLSEKFVIVL